MILGVLQARTSSSRLPGKVLKPILGRAMLELQIERLARVQAFDRLIVATSSSQSDDQLEVLCNGIGVYCYRGSLEDVLDRVYCAARPFEPSHVVRLTGDCPLADSNVVDDLIAFHLTGKFDYSSNTITPTWPDGLDAEVCSTHALEVAWNEARTPSEREHVTPFIYNRPERFRLGDFRNDEDLSSFRWTVDEPEDFAFVERVYAELYPHDPAFTSADILKLMIELPTLTHINDGFVRNAGVSGLSE